MFDEDELPVERKLPKNKLRKLSKAGKIKVYEDNDYLILIPLTHAAMITYGKGSCWCVTEPDEHSFICYQPETDPFFVIILKNKFDNDGYQIKYLVQFETSGIYDLYNQPVSYGEFFKEHPLLKNIFLEAVNNDTYKVYNDSERYCIKVDIGGYEELIGNPFV